MFFNIPCGLLQDYNHSVGAIDFHLVHAGMNLREIDIAFGFEAGAQIVILDQYCSVGVVNALKTSGRQSLLG